jgi:hypothetical protein
MIRRIILFPVGIAASWRKILFCIFFGGLQCVGHSFAHVAHFVFLEMSVLEFLNNLLGLSYPARQAT